MFFPKTSLFLYWRCRLSFLPLFDIVLCPPHIRHSSHSSLTLPQCLVSWAVKTSQDVNKTTNWISQYGRWENKWYPYLVNKYFFKSGSLQFFNFNKIEKQPELSLNKSVKKPIFIAKSDVNFDTTKKEFRELSEML